MQAIYYTGYQALRTPQDPLITRMASNKNLAVGMPAEASGVKVMSLNPHGDKVGRKYLSSVTWYSGHDASAYG
jgi:hypothetical protein